LSWDESSFSKRVGNRVVRIAFREHSVGAASVLFVARPYSAREETAERHSYKGDIVLAGRCSLFVRGAPRSAQNMPSLGPTP
jgi:hypothetical protein